MVKWLPQRQHPSRFFLPTHHRGPGQKLPCELPQCLCPLSRWKPRLVTESSLLRMSAVTGGTLRLPALPLLRHLGLKGLLGLLLGLLFCRRESGSAVGCPPRIGAGPASTCLSDRARPATDSTVSTSVICCARVGSAGKTGCVSFKRREEDFPLLYFSLYVCVTTLLFVCYV